MKCYTFDFVTISGNHLIKTFKANSADEAFDKLEKKYKVAYVNEWDECDHDEFINKFCFTH